VFHLSIKGYAETSPRRSNCFLSMFKLHCKRHYRNLATYYVAGVQRDVNTSRKRRRRDADMRSAAAAAAAHSSALVSLAYHIYNMWHTIISPVSTAGDPWVHWLCSF